MVEFFRDLIDLINVDITLVKKLLKLIIFLIGLVFIFYSPLIIYYFEVLANHFIGFGEFFKSNVFRMDVFKSLLYFHKESFICTMVSCICFVALFFLREVLLKIIFICPCLICICLVSFPEAAKNRFRKALYNNQVMRENVAIKLSDDALAKLQKHRGQTEQNYFTDCKNSYVFSTVLWYGKDTDSMVSIHSIDTAQENKFKFTNNDLEVVNPIEYIPEMCIVYVPPNSFKSNSDKSIMNGNDIKELSGYIDKVRNNTHSLDATHKISKIVFRGFADQRPHLNSSKNNNNVALSERRAKTIKSLLIENNEYIRDFCKKDESNCPTVGEGSKYAAEKCEHMREKEDLAHCQAADRKVEIKFYFRNEVN